MTRIKGFTLIELMIVVAIIGIIVAIAIPVLKGCKGGETPSECDARIAEQPVQKSGEYK